MDKTRILALLLASGMTVSMLPASALAALKDTEGHWAERSIVRWNECGVLNGDENGSFTPDMTMTRAEFAAMLVNMMGYTEKSSKTFADVPADAWYADAISKLAAAGILAGDGVNAYPTDPISREQAAVLLCHAMGFDTGTAPENAPKFTDEASVSPWARNAVAVLAAKGMVSGVGGGRFAPTLDINRASVAALLDNMVGSYINRDGAVLSGDQKGTVIIAARDVTVKDAKLSENLIVTSGAAGGQLKLENVTGGGVIMDAEGGTLKADRNTRLETLSVTAPKTALSVDGRVDRLKTGADDVRIAGSGTIRDMTVTGGENVTVDKATTVEQVENKGGKPVDVGGQTVSPGQTVRPAPGGGEPSPEVGPALKTPSARFAAASARVDFHTDYTADNKLLLVGVTYAGEPLSAAVTGGEGVSATLTATDAGSAMKLAVTGADTAASGTYQMTFTIPAEALTVKNGYKAVTRDLKVTFTLTVGVDPDYVPDLAGTSAVVIKGKKNAVGARVGDTLTVTTKQLSGTTTGLQYQWQRDGVNISGANGGEYTAVAADYNKAIKCVITSSDAGGRVEAAATEKLGKAVGPAAPTGLSAAAPSRKGAKGSITGVNSTMEYILSNGAAPGADASGTGITGEKLELPAGTYYVRVKATDTVEAGAWARVVIAEGPAFHAAITGVKVQDVVSANGSVTVHVTGTNLDAAADNWSAVRIGLSTKRTGATAADFAELSSQLTATGAEKATAEFSNVTPAGAYYVYYTMNGRNWTPTDQFVVVGAKMVEADLPAGKDTLKLTHNSSGLSAEKLAGLTVLKTTGTGETLKHELVAKPKWMSQSESIAYLTGLTGGADVTYTVVAADRSAAGESFAAVPVKSAVLTMGSGTDCTAAMLTGGNVKPADVVLFDAEGAAAGSVVGEPGKVVVTGLVKGAAYTYYVTGDGVSAAPARVAAPAAAVGGETALNIVTTKSMTSCHASSVAVLRDGVYEQLTDPKLLTSARYLNRTYLIGTGFTCEAGNYTVVTTADVGDSFAVSAKKMQISAPVALAAEGGAVLMTGNLTGMTFGNVFVYNTSTCIEEDVSIFVENNGKNAIITNMRDKGSYIVVTQAEGEITSLTPGVAVIYELGRNSNANGVRLESDNNEDPAKNAVFADGDPKLEDYLVLRKRKSAVDLITIKYAVPVINKNTQKTAAILLTLDPNSGNKEGDILIIFAKSAVFSKVGAIVAGEAGAG